MTSVLDQMRHRFETHLGDARSARKRIEELLKTEPFDRTTFVAETKAARIARVTEQHANDEFIADAISQLSPDDRHRLAARPFPPFF